LALSLYLKYTTITVLHPNIFMDAEELIKKADIQKISFEGAKIYESLKINYEPQQKGKFLAIDIDSRNVYLADDGAQAVELARQAHPNKVFYLVKIGFETAETVARSFAMNP